MRSTLVLCAVCLVLGLAGCDGFDGSLSDYTAVLPGGTGDLTTYTGVEIESNDSFNNAQSISLPEESLIDIRGALSGTSDIDIYDIGPVSADEQITVAADCDLNLDLSAAVFDEEQRLLSCNDDRSWGVDTRPSLSVVARHDCEHCYVAIAASPAVSSAQGPYSLRIIRETTTEPAPRSQVIYLNFAGGSNVTLPDGTVANIPAFDARNIDASYIGQTATMEASIEKHVKHHYARFNVQIISSTEVSSTPAGATILYFGLYNPELLGLADSVDEYNIDPVEMAIIFTDTFSLFMPLSPTVEEMATSIANVASHESGHLLGLEHTADYDDLMDTTAPADALLTDQQFKTAPLYDAIFPIGQQDGVMLLTETVGPNPNASAYDIDRSTIFVNTGPSADNRPSVNTGVVPSSNGTAGSVGASADTRRLLLSGLRSGSGYVSKDLFAVHSRRCLRR